MNDIQKKIELFREFYEKLTNEKTELTENLGVVLGKKGTMYTDDENGTLFFLTELVKLKIEDIQEELFFIENKRKNGSI